jgi:hypothetical protein
LRRELPERSGSLIVVTLAEIARVIGGRIDGNALRTTLDGVYVEVARTHSPLTELVRFQTRVYLGADRIGYPSSVGTDEFVWVRHPTHPYPTLPGHIFMGAFDNFLHASTIDDATVEDVRVTVAILVEIAKTLPATRYEKMTFEEAKRRARIERWKRRAPRLLFVAGVTLVAFLIRRR